MLKINDLKKSYGNFNALDGLTMQIERGQLYGFVGPNGAGKTTTMKIISGLLKPDAGEVLIDGVNVLQKKGYLSRVIGYMPDFFGVYDNLKVMEYMEFFSSVYGIDKKTAKNRIHRLLDLVGLENRADEDVDSLSRGMKQRLCLARTMVHEPKLLILDEPASGMEPRARIEMQDILKELVKEGTTIIVSSHILTELADMCTHIGIIEKGKMLISGSIEQIMEEQWKTNPIIMHLTEGLPVALQLLKANEKVSNIAIQGENISLHFTGDERDEADLLAQMITNGVRLSRFNREESNLETVFLQLTKE